MHFYQKGGFKMGRSLLGNTRLEARVNFVMKPELKTSLDKLAKIDSISLSRLVEIVLQRYVDERSLALKKYDEVFSSLRDERNQTTL